MFSLDGCNQDNNNNNTCETETCGISVKQFRNSSKFLHKMDHIREILPFLELSVRIDLKSIALEHVLGLTGSPDGLDLLANFPELVRKET